MIKKPEIVEKILKYFDAQLVGSSLLVYEEELLCERDIRDIDIMISLSYQEKIENFLVDEGYSSKFKNNYYQGYECVYDQVFKKENRKTIHLLYCDVPTLPPLLEVADLIAIKFKRSSESDLREIIKVCENKLMQKIKKKE